ncbi:MAG: hypothetical protein H0V83_03460 [Rubrobacter sp.]|nr:hypothetical protein [Rubrobacter sp.]
MAEHTGDYEWRSEGEEAEIVLFSPDEGSADPGIQRTLPAARLPGAESPVYAATSSEGFGWVAASSTHAAPDLTSIPRRGVLIVADAEAGDLDVPPNDILPFLMRNLSEVGLPHLDGSGVRRMCESGAIAAAEDALIEEEDLDSFVSSAGDPDALGRRAISAGYRDWEIRPRELGVKVVGETFDAEAAEELGLRPGTLVFVLDVGAGNLGRLALTAHRERIAGRDFGREGVPAAPVETEEAADLLSAFGAVSNFVDGRAALLVYALRRALSGAAGRLSVPAAWRVGGIEEDGGLLVHRNTLAAVGDEQIITAGGNVTAGTGNMSGNAPPFGAPEDDGRWPWEEAGLLERLVGLDDPRG